MSEPPDATQPTEPLENTPPVEPAAQEPEPELEPVDAAEDEVEEAEDDAVEEALTATNRVFGLLTLGIMALLLLCIVLVLIADRRAPAGL
ncbi:MAG TPA: hypothetical protein VFL82_03675 [Thermomicrobiales bacterium]|nr:hypothetical protein [Thermomicrobiales bacterium]